MKKETTSPAEYRMAEARAQHEPSGLWHYVRAYGHTDTEAELGVATEALRRHWVLDRSSIRLSASRKEQ